jgi:hypothetical protein
VTFYITMELLLRYEVQLLLWNEMVILEPSLPLCLNCSLMLWNRPLNMDSKWRTHLAVYDLLANAYRNWKKKIEQSTLSLPGQTDRQTVLFSFANLETYSNFWQVFNYLKYARIYILHFKLQVTLIVGLTNRIAPFYTKVEPVASIIRNKYEYEAYRCSFFVWTDK